MKFAFTRDLKKRSLFKKFETKRRLNFFLFNSSFLPKNLRTFFFNYNIQVFPRYSSKASFKNRCYLNNLSSSIRVINKGQISLSRQELRRVVSFGHLFPFRRSSW